MSNTVYIHGYSEREQQRLLEQNDVLAKYIYQNIDLSHHQKVLEIGCGVGAQMHYMLTTYPNLRVDGLEISPAQINKAKHLLTTANINTNRYNIYQGDAKNIPIEVQMDDYDAILLIWVLEHISAPELVLQEIECKAKPGTKIYITEVFHSGFNIYPSNEFVSDFWRKMIDFQQTTGGNADIGIILGNLLQDQLLHVESVKPFNMFFDKRYPSQRREMLTYWLELMRSALPEMITAQVYSLPEWERVETHLNALIESDESVFYYAFIQGVASKLQQ